MKNLFDRGIIAAAMRRIKAPGIVAGILAMVQVIFSITGTIIFGNLATDTTYVTDSFSIVKIPVEANVVAGALPTICVVGAFIMTLVAFNFLNSRSACDFFHALPSRRQTVYVSTVTGVVCMVGMVALCAGVLAMLLGLILMPFIEFSYASLLLIILNCIVGALLCSAATGLAMTITGTGFSNIVVSAIIIFLPQLLASLFTGCVSAMLPNDLITGQTFVGSYKCLNLAAGFMSADTLTNGWATLYSVILAGGYIALGAWRYCRRPSEMAGVSAPSRRMQAVYRILIGFAMYALITSLLFMYLYSDLSGSSLFYDSSAAVTFLFIVAYVVAAILYFVFELIMTKKWRNVARAVPGLGIVILLSAALFGGMALAYDAELSFAPKAESITSVSFENDRFNNMDYYDYSTSGEIYLEDYFLSDLGDYETSDPAAIKLVAEKLSEEVKRAKEGRSYTYYADNGGIMKVNIRSGLTRKTRYLYLNEEDFNKLTRAKQSCVERLYANIPRVSVDTNRCKFYGYYDSVEYTVQEEKRIIDTFAQEIQGYSAEEWVEADKAMYQSVMYGYITYEPADFKNPPMSPYQESTFLSKLVSEADSEVTVYISPQSLPKTYAVMEDIIKQKTGKEISSADGGYSYFANGAKALDNAYAKTAYYNTVIDAVTLKNALNDNPELVFITSSEDESTFLIDEKLYSTESFYLFVKNHLTENEKSSDCFFLEIFSKEDSDFTNYTATLYLTEDALREGLDNLVKEL